MGDTLSVPVQPSNGNRFMPLRVLAIPAAATLIRQLQELYGPLILHQSGGCCEGTAPMCFRQAASSM
jgi:uncharacterized protein (DUF779 family)